MKNKIFSLSWALGTFVATGSFLALSVALSACPRAPVAPPTDADADVTTVTVTVSDASADSSIVLDAADAPCVAACANLRKLGCPEGFGVDGGDPCEKVCGETYAGVFNIKPACLAAAKDLTGMRACGTVRCPKK